MRRPNSEDCSAHRYCPHLHYQKCRKQRERHIYYSKKPNKLVDLTSNVHPKTLGSLTTRNILTLAFQRYQDNPILPDQEDTNFSHNFYLENCPEHFQIRNTLLRNVEQELVSRNAYNLAAGATQEYNRFAKQREDYLFNARKRADEAYLHFIHSKKIQASSTRAEQNKWIIDYFRRVEELINRIFNKNNNQNQDPNIKDKQFIKEYKETNFKETKVINPKTALNILEAMRAQLLKKKINLDEQRRDQEHNKSATTSYMDTSGAGNSSQNMSAVSFISATTNSGNDTGEQHYAQKYCDFAQLMKKWGKENVQQVRNILRIMLGRDMINKAEGVQMRQKKKKKQKNQFLKKQMLKMKTNTKTHNKKHEKQNKSQKNQSEVENPPEKTVVFFKDTLTKDQQSIKASILGGGRFDSVGNIYQRNRNYSSLFKKRAQQSFGEFSFRERKEKKQRTSQSYLF